MKEKVAYVMLSELNEPFGVVTMSEDLANAMGIEDSNPSTYTYNKLGTFDDSADIANRWKEVWDLSQQG